ncbi:MAG: hypothetical protein H6772_01800 [Pseudomonadales bacterium]|nr:hypothetical protein [Pseudomonadales bacterium]
MNLEFNNRKSSPAEFLFMIDRAILIQGLSYHSLYRFLDNIGEYCPCSREWDSYISTLKVLVICDQNQGRSQVEAAIISYISRKLGMPVIIESAGSHATPDKYQGKPNPVIVNIMKNIGVSIEDAKVNQLKEEDIDNNTIVIALNNPENLPDFVFRAKVVINAFMEDHFPGSKVPEDDNALLEEIIIELTYLGINIVLKLSEALLASDISIFTNFFNKYIIAASTPKKIESC